MTTTGNMKAIVLRNFCFSPFQLLLLLLHTAPISYRDLQIKQRLGCVKIQIIQLSSGALENFIVAKVNKELIYKSHRAKSTSHAIKRAKLEVIFGINLQNCDLLGIFLTVYCFIFGCVRLRQNDIKFAKASHERKKSKQMLKISLSEMRCDTTH